MRNRSKTTRAFTDQGWKIVSRTKEGRRQRWGTIQRNFWKWHKTKGNFAWENETDSTREKVEDIFVTLKPQQWPNMAKCRQDQTSLLNYADPSLDFRLLQCDSGRVTAQFCSVGSTGLNHTLSREPCCHTTMSLESNRERKLRACSGAIFFFVQ